MTIIMPTNVNTLPIIPIPKARSFACMKAPGMGKSYIALKPRDIGKPSNVLFRHVPQRSEQIK